MYLGLEDNSSGCLPKGENQLDSALPLVWAESETLEYLKITFFPIPKTLIAEETWEYSKLLSLSLLPPTPSQSPSLLISLSASIPVPLQFILLTCKEAFQNINLIMSLSGFKICP